MTRSINTGNNYDDMRIDADVLHRDVDLSRLPGPHAWRRRGWPGCFLAFGKEAFLKIFRLKHAAVVGGIETQWFEEFLGYWRNVLGGRPLQPVDFFLLHHDYRKRSQMVGELSWRSPGEHVGNWQRTDQFFFLFGQVRNSALRPFIGRKVWKYLRPGGNVLEYGCGMAPYYYAYRNFLSYRPASWTLADIPNYPFHYAKYLYRNDPGISFLTLFPEVLEDPFRNAAEKKFDLVIMTTVFEHLDDPVPVARRLIERMNAGAHFVFDYVISDGKGMDTPRAKQEREKALRLIEETCEIVEGKIIYDRDLPFCVARKR